MLTDKKIEAGQPGSFEKKASHGQYVWTAFNRSSNYGNGLHVKIS